MIFQTFQDWIFHNFQWIILTTMPCLFLHSLWTSFEDSLTTWLTVLTNCTTHSTRKSTNTFFNVVFDIVVLIACSCAEHIRASLGILKSHFLKQSQDFSVSFLICLCLQKLSIHLFLCPVFYHILIQQFLKIFFETPFELQNPEML